MMSRVCLLQKSCKLEVEVGFLNTVVLRHAVANDKYMKKSAQAHFKILLFYGDRFVENDWVIITHPDNLPSDSLDKIICKLINTKEIEKQLNQLRPGSRTSA